MPTFRAFAFNTGSTISGTEQVGSIAINSATTLSGNVVWWAGPDEDLGYVVAEAVSGGTMTGANGQPAYLGFYRSTTLTNASFISLANYLAQGQQVFTGGAAAKTWLNNNGYWTSYVSDFYQFISTSISGYFGIGISQMGVLYSWGKNTDGQLGINSTESKFIPVTVSGVKKTFCKIAVGQTYSLAIDQYGQLWSWGSNLLGQLANNSTTAYSTPKSISGAKKTFCHVTARAFPQFSGALDKYGQLWSWGEGTNGVLGNNNVLPRSTPVSVCGAKKTFCQVAANNNVMHALDQYGQIWSWGSGASGQLGNNSVVSYSTPISLCGAKKTFCQLTPGAAIDKYGQIWCWGSNFGGFLGNNSATDTSTPVSICGARKTFCQLASLNGSRGAIDIYGRLWVWGTNADFFVGSADASTPRLIGGANKTFCKIFGGGRPGFAQTYNRVTWSWGNNEFGVRAINFANPNLTPISICGARKTFCDVNSKGSNSLGLTQSGKLYAWGANFFGELGTNDSTAICRQTPVGVYNFATKTYCQITTASSTSYAIDETGLVWTWGANTVGQLGINSTVQRCTPGSILGFRKTICKIDGGSNFILSIDKNGLIWGWGQGNFGKLGIGASANRSTPVSICGALKTFCHVAASTTNGYGIDIYGQVWSWGAATQGQLGNNQAATLTNTPISICGAKKTFCKINAGGNVVMAIDKYGQIWGWGSNNTGQLADNTITARSTPVSVAGAKKTFCDVFVANANVLAVDQYGKIWAWGDNTYGSFGNNTVGSANNKSTPVAISGAVKTFCHVTTTNEQGSLGIDKYGIVWSWGQDNFGQLAHNYTYRTPMMICNL